MQPPQDDTVKRGEMPGEQMPESEPAQTVLKQLLLLAASILILLGGTSGSGIVPAISAIHQFFPISEG